MRIKFIKCTYTDCFIDISKEDLDSIYHGDIGKALADRLDEANEEEPFIEFDDITTLGGLYE